jgi:hypothetical protein
VKQVREKDWPGFWSSSGAVPAMTSWSAMANSSGLKDRPARTSFRGVVSFLQGSIGCSSSTADGQLAHAMPAVLDDHDGSLR